MLLRRHGTHAPQALQVHTGDEWGESYQAALLELQESELSASREWLMSAAYR